MQSNLKNKIIDINKSIQIILIVLFIITIIIFLILIFVKYHYIYKPVIILNDNIDSIENTIDKCLDLVDNIIDELPIINSLVSNSLTAVNNGIAHKINSTTNDFCKNQNFNINIPSNPFISSEEVNNSLNEFTDQICNIIL